MSHPHLTTSVPDESRYSFYRNIHKALRLGHCRMLAELGAHDFSDAQSTRDLLSRLRGLIELGRSHLEGENREIHAAIEARATGASAHAAEDHSHHERAFAEIESLVRAVDIATPARRSSVGHALYLRYALFAAADIAHMHEEETELLCALHKAFSDAELHAIEGRIVAAVPPAKMMAYMKLMMPALNHAERVALLGSLKAAMPPQAFSGVLAEGVRPALDPAAFHAAASALGLREAA